MKYERQKKGRGEQWELFKLPKARPGHVSDLLRLRLLELKPGEVEYTTRARFRQLGRNDG